jgi:hypothetical protein
MPNSEFLGVPTKIRGGLYYLGHVFFFTCFLGHPKGGGKPVEERTEGESR